MRKDLAADAVGMVNANVYYPPCPFCGERGSWRMGGVTENNFWITASRHCGKCGRRWLMRSHASNHDVVEIREAPQ